ncbi:glycosyltransferase [Lactobacillus delbrueckii subsp. bulgaricus]|uniref:glycosyltransferase n=1 Tax=Lactobacillus delbrueckii TaxID=1584 RepID=UPI001E5E545B|nr:glycosyltransferase [Lactobacillus delbrueckii]MCD5467383.1 glycosyltransferase [Lactobacillus delbrueckii subsp. bulgaricus]MCD5482309.1 glycosyltransferase [Lactobacillus delbrueckii subsp. bulgaricus]
MTKRILEVNVDDNGYSGVYSLIKRVIENKPANYQIDLACLEPFESQDNISYLNQLGTQVYYIGYPGNKICKQFKYYENLQKVVKNGNYDYIHIHGDVANKLYVTALAAYKADSGAKIILHSHASEVDGEHRQLKRFVHKSLRGRLVKLADRYVSVSDLASDWMFPSVPKSQIIKIMNGVDLAAFRYDPVVRKNVRNKLGLSGKHVLGHIGRFAYQKNHQYLIQIFAQVYAQDPKARLLLVGKGDLADVCRQQVHELGLDKQVIFYGLSSNTSELFQAMDVFLLPSHFEGLPIVGVEAQAAGVPVIFSDQITCEAKMTDNVDFLPIDEESLPAWCRQVITDLKLGHCDNYDILSRKKMDITDTVTAFIELYNS